MEQHDRIRLYLDQDTTGQKCSRYAVSLSPKYEDESSLYQHYKDLNQCVMHIGKQPKKNVRHKHQ